MPTESTSSSTTDAEEIPVSGDPAWPPVHPGEVLAETVLPELRLSVAGAARELGVSPEMALRLGQWCGNGPHLWLRLQERFDLWHAQRRLADTLARIPSHAA